MYWYSLIYAVPVSTWYTRKHLVYLNYKRIFKYDKELTSNQLNSVKCNQLTSLEKCHYFLKMNGFKQIKSECFLVQ